MQGVLILFTLLTLILIVFKLILCELDGRNANKRYNLRYFIEFSKPFKYGKAKSMVIISFLCLLIFSDLDFTTLSGILYCLLFLVCSVLMDIVSQFSYYLYGKKRFAVGTQKALSERDYLMQADQVVDYDGIIYPSDAFSFIDICQKEFKEDQHVAIASVDGGKFASTFTKLPYVTFVIDHYESLAKQRLENTTIKTTTLTSSNGLPFKDERLDAYIVNYSNFDKNDVRRVLKPNGKLIVRYKGDQDMKELVLNVFARVNQTKWNSEICSQILNTNGYYVTEKKEVNNQVRFTSIESLLTYLKINTPDNMINIDMYLNQLAFIHSNIKKKGQFALSFNEFYIIANKQ